MVMHPPCLLYSSQRGATNATSRSAHPPRCPSTSACRVVQHQLRSNRLTLRPIFTAFCTKLNLVRNAPIYKAAVSMLNIFLGKCNASVLPMNLWSVSAGYYTQRNGNMVQLKGDGSLTGRQDPEAPATSMRGFPDEQRSKKDGS